MGTRAPAGQGDWSIAPSWNGTEVTQLQEGRIRDIEDASSFDKWPTVLHLEEPLVGVFGLGLHSQQHDRAHLTNQPLLWHSPSHDGAHPQTAFQVRLCNVTYEREMRYVARSNAKDVVVVRQEKCQKSSRQSDWCASWFGPGMSTRPHLVAPHTSPWRPCSVVISRTQFTPVFLTYPSPHSLLGALCARPLCLWCSVLCSLLSRCLTAPLPPPIDLCFCAALLEQSSVVRILPFVNMTSLGPVER